MAEKKCRNCKTPFDKPWNGKCDWCKFMHVAADQEKARQEALKAEGKADDTINLLSVSKKSGVYKFTVWCDTHRWSLFWWGLILCFFGIGVILLFFAVFGFLNHEE